MTLPGKPSLSELHRIISKAYSGARAKQIVTGLYRHNRLITAAAYEKGAQACCDLMKGMGLDDVRLLKFPSGNGRFYGNWKTPEVWNVTEAWLEVRISGRWVKMADYAKIPTSVMVYAAPTDGVVETEMVPWGSPDIKGKLIYCDVKDDEKLTSAALDAEKAGAAGIATDFSPNWDGVRGEDDFRDGHRWDNGTLFKLRKPLAGFSLSRNQGEVIRKELAKGKPLACRFRIRGKLGKGYICCATGCIRGKGRPNEEIVSVAHLYEAGANDNCSGVAASIEALQAIKGLIKSGVLPKPERTIRVVFTFEIVGFIAYFLHARKLKKNYIAGVNPDMVGEDQEKCRSTLNIYQSPHSATGFWDPLLLNFLEKSIEGKLRYAIKTCIINDNVVSDPTLGVPCPALIHLRDRFYHSNEDTPDKVSADTLKRVGGAMAAYLYACAVMNAGLAPEAALMCVRFSADRLKVEEKKGLDAEKLGYFIWKEKQRLKSLESLTGVRLDREIDELDALRDSAKTQSAKSPKVTAVLKEQAESIVPVRTVAGPMTFEHIPYARRKKLKFHAHWSTQWNLPLFWADGKKNLYEIYTLAGFESGPYELRDFIAYFKFLEKESLIRFKR